MDEDFIFKVSLVLFCFLSLLLPLVLFLAVWLAKIQNRVDSISSGWSVFCKLAASEENLTQPTEIQPEVPNASSTPLVIFNQQAKDSENNISWKHITRAFAYAPADDDEDGPHPNEEDSTCASEGEVKEADEESKSQEEIVPDPSISVDSYLQIVDDNPAIVAISSSERPATDAKHEERRRYLSVTSYDDEPLFDNNCSAENEPSAQQINSKENGILEDSQGSETGKPECVVLIEDNEKQTTEVFIEVPDVKTPMCEELQNGTATQEVERKDANGKIMDGEKVLNEGDSKHTSENHSNPSSTSEDAGKAMSPHGEESKSVVPNETRPIPRPRLSKKNRRRINSEEKRKTAKRASNVDNTDETNRHSHIPGQDPDRQDRTVVIPVSAQHHTTSPSKTGVKSKINTKGENQVQIVNDVRHPDNRSGTSDEAIPNYESVAISARSVAVEPDNGSGGKGMVTYDYATTQEVTKGNESSSVISQLRGIVRNNPREPQHLDEEWTNTTARHEATKSPSEDSYPVVRQENNNTNTNLKGKGKRAKRTSYPHNPDDTNRHGHDTNQHAVKQGRTEHHDASGFQQTAQQHAKAQYRTGALSKSNTKGDNEVKSAKDAEHPHNKPGTSDGGMSDYEVVVTSMSGGKVEPDNKGNGKLIYDYATTQEMTESDESPSIIFQLRSLLHKNPRESHCVDKGNKTTAGYPVVRQENEADKEEGDTCHATTAEQDHQNTSEQIYSSVDEEGNDIYSEIPSSVAKTGPTYIDQNVAHNVPDSEPFYVNLPFQQGSVNFNGGLDLRNGHGPSIYSNNDIIDI